MQQTQSTHTRAFLLQAMRHVQEEKASIGPHVYCLVRKMESDKKVLQMCTAIEVADALLEKPKRKRSGYWENDYLLERKTKGSYGGLLTELSLEKEIFKEY